jgi:hypothetical protein
MVHNISTQRELKGFVIVARSFACLLELRSLCCLRNALSSPPPKKQARSWERKFFSIKIAEARECLEKGKHGLLIEALSRVESKIRQSKLFALFRTPSLPRANR